MTEKNGPPNVGRLTFEGDGFRFAHETPAPKDEDADDDDAGRVGVPPAVLYEKYACTREACFGCLAVWRKPDKAGKNPAMDELWAVNERNRMEVSPPELSRILAEAYVRLIEKPAFLAGKPCSPWPRHVIERHITGAHNLDPVADLSNMLHTYKSIERAIAERVVTESTTELGYKINGKRLKQLLDVGEKKLKTYAALDALVHKHG